MSQNQGRIYVVKPSFAGAAVKVSVFCDDKLIGNATNGSYLCWDVDAGEHTIGNTQRAHAGATLGAAQEEDIIRINVQPSKTYYIKLAPRMGGMDFKQLDEEEGRRTISGRKKPKLNYID